VKDAQKPDHVSLSTLIDRLREGRYAIPDFQREFEWMPWDIRDLMRSIFLDYYIGSLLLWKGKHETFEALSCEPVYGYSGTGNPELIVLDGQQRLTAMYYAFIAPDIPLPRRASRYLYYIHVDKFMEEAYDEAIDYDWTKWSQDLLKDQELQFREHIFPLSIVGQGNWDLPNWVQDYEKYWLEKVTTASEAGDDVELSAATRNAENAKGFGEHLKGITQQYQIAFIELDRELALDKVCDIFTQVNSKGVRLDVFDLLNAMLKPKGLQLKHMWRKAAPRLEFVETEKMNVYILQVMSILQQGYCSPKYLYYLLPGQAKSVREPDGSLRKEILIPDTSSFETLWDDAVEAVQKTIAVLRHPQEFGAISSQYVPYVSILPAFAAIRSLARELPASRQLDAERKIRHWYWASVFTNRYSGSVESTAARDFFDMKAWLDDDALEPALLEEFRTRFRALDLRKETKRGTSVYNGIFNLLVIGGARDWMTGGVPQYGDLDDHHIVPKSWGNAEGLGTIIDSILNRTPLTAETNRKVISDHLPNAYLPQLIEESGESAVQATLESHFISPLALDLLLRDPFTPADFEEFLAERQRTIQDAIENLLVKERLDLSVPLRELDAQIEQVEQALRHTIDVTLGGEPSRLPQHVQGNVDERIQAAARKNPALDVEHYQTLIGKLEYCDLREIQDVITSKTLWTAFEAQFVSKEMLATRFGQLARLRNGIRHTRTVDQVTRMDGEAALLWFKQVLGV